MRRFPRALRSKLTGGYTETQLVSACLQLLRAHRISAWRQNNFAGPVFSRKGVRHFVRPGRLGMADISGIWQDGRRLEIECKRPGQPLASDQIEFHAMIQASGGIAWTVYSVEQLEQKILDARGGRDGSTSGVRVVRDGASPLPAQHQAPAA